MTREEDIAILISEIKGIQLQLRVLEERIRGLIPTEKERKGFPDLMGLWAGADFSEEEIKEAEIKVKEFPK